MEFSDFGYALVKNFEGLRLRPYRDANGDWTIGYGHKMTLKEYHLFIMGISAEKADQILHTDMNNVCNFIKLLLPGVLNQNQLDAVCMFTMNIGGNKFLTSTMYKKLKVKDLVGASQEFPRWVHDSKGDILEGLVTRRDAEQKLFLKPVQNA